MKKTSTSNLIRVEVLVNGIFLSLYEDVYSASDMIAPTSRPDDEVLINMYRFLSIVHRKKTEFQRAIPNKIIEDRVNNSLAIVWSFEYKHDKCTVFGRLLTSLPSTLETIRSDFDRLL